jgi:hypothetical protein
MITDKEKNQYSIMLCAALATAAAGLAVKIFMAPSQSAKFRETVSDRFQGGVDTVKRSAVQNRKSVLNFAQRAVKELVKSTGWSTDRFKAVIADAVQQGMKRA